MKKSVFYDCKNAQGAVAKVVTVYPAGDVTEKVEYFGNYADAEEKFGSKFFKDLRKKGLQQSLWFRGVKNRWIEMVEEEC